MPIYINKPKTNKKVGMAGVEPTHIRIKNKCLTAWLHSTRLVTSD